MPYCNCLPLVALVSKLPLLHEPTSLSSWRHSSISPTWGHPIARTYLRMTFTSYHFHGTANLDVNMLALRDYAEKACIVAILTLSLFKLLVQDKSSVHQDSSELSRIIRPIISIPHFEASWLAHTTPCHGTSNRYMIKEFDSTLALPWQLGSFGREVHFTN